MVLMLTAPSTDVMRLITVSLATAKHRAHRLRREIMLALAITAAALIYVVAGASKRVAEPVHTLEETMSPVRHDH